MRLFPTPCCSGPHTVLAISYTCPPSSPTKYPLPRSSQMPSSPPKSPTPIAHLPSPRLWFVVGACDLPCRQVLMVTPHPNSHSLDLVAIGGVLQMEEGLPREQQIAAKARHACPPPGITLPMWLLDCPQADPCTAGCVSHSPDALPYYWCTATGATACRHTGRRPGCTGPILSLERPRSIKDACPSPIAPFP